MYLEVITPVALGALGREGGGGGGVLACRF